VFVMKKEHKALLPWLFFPVAVFVLNAVFDRIVNLGEGGMFLFSIISIPVLPVFYILNSPSIPYNVTYAVYVFSVILFYPAVGMIINVVRSKWSKGPSTVRK
jgi:hypothetical protein